MVYFYKLLEDERIVAIAHEGLVKKRDLIPDLKEKGWSEDRIKRLFPEYKGMEHIESEIAIAENELKDIHRKIREFITGTVIL